MPWVPAMPIRITRPHRRGSRLNERREIRFRVENQKDIMSKKDLLERLSRAPMDSRSRREEEDPKRASEGESVTTRVSRKVVRRRRDRRPAGTTTVTRRRAAVVSDE